MKRIGEIGFLQVIAKDVERSSKPRNTTPADQKRRAAAEAVRNDPQGAEAAYTARHLVQCTLPYKDPGDVPAWSRRSGNTSLGIQPGWDYDEGRSIGYPFGAIPRLLLFWLITQLVHVKDRPDLTTEQKRRVELGSLPDFMREIGMNPRNGSGTRGDRKRLEGQMRRLFQSKISFQETRRRADGSTAGLAWLNMDVAPKGELWWDAEREGQPPLFPSWVMVGEDFFQAATAVPVPVDMRALKALKRSPIALDLYALLSFVAYMVQQRGEPVLMRWRSLADQLGADYSDPKDFKKRVQTELQKVREFLNVTILPVRGGFKVCDGTPAIPAKAARRAIKAT